MPSPPRKRTPKPKAPQGPPLGRSAVAGTATQATVTVQRPGLRLQEALRVLAAFDPNMSAIHGVEISVGGQNVYALMVAPTLPEAG